MTESRLHRGMRARWSAVGAAVAITLGAGGLGVAQAAVSTGERPVTVTIAPERILDTRVDLGLAGKFTHDDGQKDLQVTGSVEVASGGMQTVVPDDAVAVLVNVTVIRPNRPGFLSLRPGGATGFPTTSTVNFFAESIEPNAATVDLNDGKIQITFVDTISDAGSAHVAIDVVGYTIDHDHDDRYYTKADVDAAIAAAVATKADAADTYTRAEVDALTKPLFATIDFDGSIRTDSSGVVSSSRTGTGQYTITFDRDVDTCAATTSDFLFFETRDVSASPVSGSSDQILVRVTNAAEGLEDTVFSVILQCPPI